MPAPLHIARKTFRQTIWIATCATISITSVMPAQAASAAAVVTPWGTINEPPRPPVCKQMQASLS
ncbi:polygalacturonase, partial [Pseudomonas syringae pv. tagetis]